MEFDVWHIRLPSHWSCDLSWATIIAFMHLSESFIFWQPLFLLIVKMHMILLNVNTVYFWLLLVLFCYFSFVLAIIDDQHTNKNAEKYCFNMQHINWLYVLFQSYNLTIDCLWLFCSINILLRFAIYDSKSEFVCLWFLIQAK